MPAYERSFTRYHSTDRRKKSKEKVIKIEPQSDREKLEEYIAEKAFDVLFAIEEGYDEVFLKSEGNAIPVCADLALEVEKRLKAKSNPYRMRIFLNSKFFNSKRSRKNSKDKIPGFNFSIVSFMDIKFYFNSR